MFGLNREIPEHLVFSYVGVGLCALSSILYMFVRTEVSGQPRDTLPGGYVHIDEDPNHRVIDPNMVDAVNQQRIPMNNPVEDPDEAGVCLNSMSTGTKRLIGCSLAVISGALYGFQFVPYLYVSQNYEDASSNALDYVFAQFVGIYAGSLVYLLLYAAMKCNKPMLYPGALLPGMACGMMRAVAVISWFITNEALGESVSYPIISTGPPVVANLWAILLFREIKGCRNFFTLTLAFAITIIGVVFIVISKL